MPDLSTKYMGLRLKNPIIAGSSGLTRSVENIVELEKQGAAAVVLKSLFEEQIRHEGAVSVAESTMGHYYSEADDYIRNYSRENSIEDYLKLIEDARAAVSIPIIASINCITSSDWTTFARRMQEAGANGLELNVFILPSDPYQDGEENERVYFDIVSRVKKQVSIPVALKISHYFSGLAKTALKLSWTGIDGMVMFNRFFSPDIDTETLKVKASHIFSHPDELTLSLRWVAMLSDRLHCDIAASTGIHDAQAVIKQLLAGARAVQIASVLYQEGFQSIPKMLDGLSEWMQDKGYERLEDFIGLLSVRKADNPAAYERVQFMKHFSGIE
jgi:dihydroorotate dehydrogenase (fumarate)